MSNIDTDEPNAKRKRRRVFTGARVLLVLLILSLAQYVQTGTVSWLTDTFRWVEHTVSGLAKDPRATLDSTGTAIREVAAKVLPGEFASATTPAAKTNVEISWSEPAYDLSGRVVKVVDGDSLTIIDRDRVTHKIRLHGIDSPEYDQPHYLAAKTALSQFVSGKGVGIDVKDRDSYGRTVGVIYINGRNVNLQMVRLGHAWWYRRYAALNDALREAEQHAQIRQLGLWAQPEPVAPWDWRRRRR